MILKLGYMIYMLRFKILLNKMGNGSNFLK